MALPKHIRGTNVSDTDLAGLAQLIEGLHTSSPLRPFLQYVLDELSACSDLLVMELR